MSFKIKILKWNLISLAVSIFVAFIAGMIAARLLFVKFFGYFLEMEEVLHSPMFRAYVIQLTFAVAMAFVISLLITNTVVYYEVSKKIIEPLENLRDGIKEMSLGNFDYKFSYTSTDELGDITSYIQELQNKLKNYVAQINEHDMKNMELISSISHDLKTPITTILGYTEGILDNVADTKEKQTNYLLKIKKKARELESLIEQLLLSSKLDLNKISYQLERTDIVFYVMEIIDETKIDLDNNNMSVSFGNESTSPFANLDKNRFKRVVLNIITNSIKYKKDGLGHIDIKFKNVADSVVVSFKDNGIGIDKDKLPLIFNSFYKVDESRQETGASSGLGLSIAKLIVDGHGGKIWAKSSAGEGTTIFISIKHM